MSELFKFPYAFVRHGDCDNTGAAEAKTSEHCRSAGGKNRSILLRSDHLVLWALEGLLAFHAALKRWRSRQRTFRALGELDEEQLRDVGLMRGHHKSYQALAELDETQLCHLSERGLRTRREVRRKSLVKPMRPHGAR